MAAVNYSMVVVYKNNSAADGAINNLVFSGFNKRNISFIGRDILADEQAAEYGHAEFRLQNQVEMVAFCSGIHGVLIDPSSVFIPGAGLFLVAGPLVGWITEAREGGVSVDGVGMIGVGLCCLGIPKDSVKRYEAALSARKPIVITCGTAAEINHAKGVIYQGSHEMLFEHQLSVMAGRNILQGHSSRIRSDDIVEVKD
jgi:hypothetical protein